MSQLNARNSTKFSKATRNEVKVRFLWYDYSPVISEQEDIMYTFDEYLNAENYEQSDESPLLSKHQTDESIINPVEEEEDEEENGESASKIPTKEAYLQLQSVVK